MVESLHMLYTIQGCGLQALDFKSSVLPSSQTVLFEAKVKAKVKARALEAKAKAKAKAKEAMVKALEAMAKALKAMAKALEAALEATEWSVVFKAEALKVEALKALVRIGVVLHSSIVH